MWVDPEDGTGEEFGAWLYGVVTDRRGEEVTVEFESSGQQDTFRLADLAEAELLEGDPAQDYLADLEATRAADLAEAIEGHHDAVLISTEDIREEADAFRWLSSEVEAQADELERLRAEQRELLEERERFRALYEELLEQSEQEEAGGAAAAALGP